MKLTKAEGDILGYTEFAGTKEELIAEVTQTYWVYDDAPMPYWEREKPMKVLAKLATKLGVEL